jgi:hypothetical protein
MQTRREVWRRLGAELKPAALKTIAQPIGMEGLPEAFATLLKGGARGRFVVHIGES